MPRSGTTIVQEAFSKHEVLGWLSNYTAHFPGLAWVTFVHRLFGGAQGQRSQGQRLAHFNKILPRPSESYAVWQRIFGDRFLYSFLTDAVASDREIERGRKYVSTLLKAQGKQRFCAKLTGPPRISFLSQVFPEAYFIDIVRDPRAVVASLMVDRDSFWGSKGGRETPFWDGALTDEDLSLWKESGRLPVVLAGLQWAAVYRQTKAESPSAGGRYTRVRYEEFIRNPAEQMDRLTRFCNLDPSNRVRLYADKICYDSRDRKFENLFSSEELSWLEHVVGGQLEELGYERVAPGNSNHR